MIDIEDKLLGMFYGCAIGDSFGMPVEMWSRSKIQSRFGFVSDFLPGPPDNEISAGFKAGETTDDTIVAVITAELLIATEGKPNPIDIVRRIEQWALDNPKSKTIIGPSTRRSFDAIAAGVPVEEAGRHGETNGAATRVAPAGALCHCDDIEGICKLAHSICKATHNTGVALAGASATAAAVSWVMDGNSLRGMLPTVKATAEYGYSLGWDTQCPSVARRLTFCFQLSDSIADDEDFIEEQSSLIGSGLLMAEAVPTALTVAYRCNGDIMRAARLCTNMGGDTDTVSAISCMVTGAAMGVDKISESALKVVKAVNSYPFEDLAKGLTQLRQNLLGDGENRELRHKSRQVPEN